MKRIFIILMILCLAIPAMGQVEGTGVQVNQNQITVLIDSSTAKSVWYGFPGAGTGTQGFSETAIDPKNRVFNTGDLTVCGQLTVSSGTEASDSLFAYALPLGPDGYVMGEDTLWFDWDSHTTRTTEQTGADGYLDWTEFSGTLGVTTYSFWINMTNKYPPCWGLKFVFDNFTGEGDSVSDMITSLVLQIGEVR
jgi:hypothetical protein